jgi:HlyD family secretion protein
MDASSGRKRRRRIWWIIPLVLVLVGGGGYYAYAGGYIPWFKPQQAAQAQSTLQTATVTVGDLSITADGSGQLVAGSTADLAFPVNGTLMELLVKVGDHVKKDDVLAWIDDTDARNAVADAQLSVKQAQDALDAAKDTAALQQAVSKAELGVAQAEQNLSTAQQSLDDLVNWAPDETQIKVDEANLVVAQASYQNTVTKVNLGNAQLASARISLDDAVRSLQDAQTNYANAMDSARDFERNIESTRENAARALQKAQDALTTAQYNYDVAKIDTSAIDIQNAQLKVLSAQQALDDLKTPPTDADIAAARVNVQAMQVALQQAKLDLADAQKALADVNTEQAELTLQQAKLKLESAQKALDGTTLVAPIDGTVTSVNAQVGETTNGTAISLADLDKPVVEFWLDETDLSNVAVGNPVNIVFDALPDLTYNGTIYRVDPALVTVGNTPAVQAWATIDTSANPAKLLGDMNASVEVVAAEARNALLVPVQALRELGPDKYAVFVVQSDGQLEMRMVNVGIKDYVNAVVLSGLQRGEVVSLGEKTASSSTSSTTTRTTTNSNNNNGGPVFFGGGGFGPPD